MRSPYSPAGAKGSGKSMASSIDGYEVHMHKWGGMMIEDPTKVIDVQVTVEK